MKRKNSKAVGIYLLVIGIALGMFSLFVLEPGTTIASVTAVCSGVLLGYGIRYIDKK